MKRPRGLPGRIGIDAYINEYCSLVRVSRARSLIVFLRKYYLHHGLPIHARITAKALNDKFAALGGNKYLHRLFSRGPVTQGSRFANLRTPAYATDLSFGSSY